MKKEKYFRMQKVNETTADVFIEGDIVGEKFSDTETSAKSFRDGLKSLGNVSEMNVHVNSGGGSVFDGIAIYNMLKQHSAKINIYIDGLAASIASVIAMSGDTIFMPSNAMMMIHQPWSFSMGNAKEMRKMAETLDTISKSSIVTYLEKAGDKLDEDTLVKMMDEETWLTADEAVSYGLADQVLDSVDIAASVSDDFLERYTNVPDFLLKKRKPTDDDSDDDETDADDDDKKPLTKKDPKKPSKDDDPDSDDEDEDDKNPNPKTDNPDSDDDEDEDDPKRKKKAKQQDEKLIQQSAEIARKLEEMYRNA